MSVAEALQTRVSTRAFLPDPIPADQLRQLFERCLQSPSNCNVQPWQIFVVSGARKEELKRQLVAEVTSGKPPRPDFEWGLKYEGVYRERQFGAAAALYGAMEIERGDRPARDRAMLRNWEFFDAPHAAFFTMERSAGLRGAVDLGIFAQSLCLLMTEEGVGSCLQGALNQYTDPIHALLDIPPQLGVVFGLSFGYADPAAPANRARTSREPLERLVTFCE